MQHTGNSGEEDGPDDRRIAKCQQFICHGRTKITGRNVLDSGRNFVRIRNFNNYNPTKVFDSAFETVAS